MFSLRRPTPAPASARHRTQAGCTLVELPAASFTITVTAPDGVTTRVYSFRV